MKKRFSISNTYLYLFLFVVISIVATFSLTRIINGYEGRFITTSAEVTKAIGDL